MEVSVELSMYPLTRDYERIISEFILRLKAIEGIEVRVTGLSTHVFGPYGLVMDSIRDELRNTMKSDEVVLTTKIVPGVRRSEDLPDALK